MRKILIPFGGTLRGTPGRLCYTAGSNQLLSLVPPLYRIAAAGITLPPQPLRRHNPSTLLDPRTTIPDHPASRSLTC